MVLYLLFHVKFVDKNLVSLDMFFNLMRCNFGVFLLQPMFGPWQLQWWYSWDRFHSMMQFWWLFEDLIEKWRIDGRKSTWEWESNATYNFIYCLSYVFLYTTINVGNFVHWYIFQCIFICQFISCVWLERCFLVWYRLYFLVFIIMNTCNLGIVERVSSSFFKDKTLFCVIQFFVHCTLGL